MGRKRPGARGACGLYGVLIAGLLPAGCSSPPPKKTPEPAIDRTARIVQFYSRDPVLPKGEKTVLCYGVDNAKTVRLDPPVDRVWPAQSRCIEIAPTQNTTYTLTAAGEDGKEVSKTTELKIGAARPKLNEVSVNALEVKIGDPVMICYKAKNAVSVKVTPGREMSDVVQSPDHGCVVDHPGQTTRYTVTAVNRDGVTDEEHVTVKVK